MTEPIAKTAPFRPQDHLKPFPPLSPSTTEPLKSIPHEQPNENGTAHTNKHNDDTIPPLPTVIARIHARVQAFLNESHAPDTLLASVQRQTRISLEVVSTALQRYKLSELSVSYNGGKDCLVLLILQTTQTPPPADLDAEAQIAAATAIPAIYALPPDPFDSVEEFVISSAEAYHLAITKYTTAPPASTLRSSFEDYLARHPGIRAIFVGTRRTDPHGAQLTHFDRTDGGWPDFVRVHPVIDWHYAEIWAFIRHLDLRYCSLYDEGYTSLGGTSDTHPNPRLRIGAEADGQYLPAYQLTEDLEERLGRN
ncbi:Phosphoadenosine phosphosulfate reductase [Penicillium cf. griseofulvum]|nr:Phosphoadenosine phosphosulfate reductase [Penicillium cf. griseofulvum]